MLSRKNEGKPVYEDFGLLFTIAAALSIAGALSWVLRLYHKVRILAYCYIDLSDWTARKLEENLTEVRSLQKEVLSVTSDDDAGDTTEIEVDDWIMDDIRNWEEGWRELVVHHFDIMKRNGIEPPGRRDLATPLQSWYK
jgi:hypothetical protein|tara:strand:- start:170 stop:586 length:417 start_codon:yes stop_codon:yes gene_type:complete